MSEAKPNRLVILNKGRGQRYEKQFFFDIQAAILDGYRVADTDSRRDVSMRNYKGIMGRAVLYIEQPKAEVAPVVEPVVEPVIAPELSIEEKLESFTKKAELLALAKELEIEVPEGTNAPLKIKKVIKDALNK